MKALLALFISIVSHGMANLSKDYESSIQLDDREKSFMLYWTNKPDQGKMMHFAIEVKTTGWVSFGFADKIGNMDGYDVLISYVVPGRTDFHDYFTQGHKAPSVDDNEDYFLMGSSEANGTTTIRFKRKLNTVDDEDLIIKPGKMWVVWAYNKYDDISRKHDKRGYKQITLISTGPSYAHATGWVLLLTALFGVSFNL